MEPEGGWLMALTEADWIAFKAEWVLGLQSDRALCRRYGIDKTQLRRKIASDGWTRPEGLNAAIEQEAVRQTDDLLDTYQSHIDRGGDRRKAKRNNVVDMLEHVHIFGDRNGTSPQRNGDRFTADTDPHVAEYERRRAAKEDRARPPMSDKLRELATREMQSRAVENAITTLQQAMLAHLGGAARMRGIAIAVADKMLSVLVGTDHESEKAQKRLFAGGGSLPQAIAALARLEETIQKIERAALGLDTQKQVNVTVGEPAPGAQIKSDPETGKPLIDVTQLPDAHLEALGQVLERLKMARSVELPLPPKGPERL